MKTYTTDRIRNVVLVGHSGAGKTTLAEAMLLRAGAITRAGRVDDGTSLLCADAEEVKRQLSLSLALAPFEWTATDGAAYKVNVIDTPGYADFIGEVDAAFAVADLAVFVVSAVEGVEVQTELLWRRADELRLPRMVFVNKEDKDRASFASVLDQLRARLGNGFAPLEMPLGEAASLHGVVDILTEEALEYDRSGGHRAGPLPDDMAAEEHRLHDHVVEEIVSGDDEQLERYLSGDVPPASDLERALAHEVLDCLEFPVLLGSAVTGVGVDRLADFICELGPSPAARPTSVMAGAGDGAETVPVPADASAKPLAYVFKTVADPFVGQLSMFKVLSGRIAADDQLLNSSNGTSERLHGLFMLRGREQEPLHEVVAGDIAAVAKLAATHTGDTLAPKGMPVRVPMAERPASNFAVAIAPRTQGDDDKLGSALDRLRAEDPCLHVERSETHQTLLSGVGDTHVTVAIERLARKFGVHVDTVPVRVAYRETVTGSADAVGKVKKQSGGHGQFAIVNLRVAPLPRGAGFQFKDAVVGGAIPRNYIPAVAKGVEEAMTQGGVHGFPVVDVTVDCYDGRYHSVDSSEMAFKTAAALGLRDAMAAAGAAVLEPISLLRVTVPVSSEGDVLGDITSRRGRIQGTDAAPHGEHAISALVPTSELVRYAVDLRSMTGGRGRYVAQHDHYDVLPAHLVEQVKTAHAAGSRVKTSR